MDAGWYMNRGQVKLAKEFEIELIDGYLACYLGHRDNYIGE